MYHVYFQSFQKQIDIENENKNKTENEKFLMYKNNKNIEAEQTFMLVSSNVLRTVRM